MKCIGNENKTYRTSLICKKLSKKEKSSICLCHERQMCPETTKNMAYTGILLGRCMAAHKRGFALRITQDCTNPRKGIHSKITFSFNLKKSPFHKLLLRSNCLKYNILNCGFFLFGIQNTFHLSLETKYFNLNKWEK